eukprot:TRINITY_DN16752_c0_g1_i1.p1 TRINITY_DN16752_c0_g1~~TRINITY_DN16752_c0_g1_i1.p1  ORF type:complete len:220 (+),score=68.42 TRINITY_DN16752_c0_g1_i1:247-906(+)
MKEVSVDRGGSDGETFESVLGRYSAAAAAVREGYGEGHEDNTSDSGISSSTSDAEEIPQSDGDDSGSSSPEGDYTSEEEEDKYDAPENFSVPSDASAVKNVNAISRNQPVPQNQPSVVSTESREVDFEEKQSTQNERQDDPSTPPRGNDTQILSPEKQNLNISERKEPFEVDRSLLAEKYPFLYDPKMRQLEQECGNLRAMISDFQMRNQLLIEQKWKN